MVANFLQHRLRIGVKNRVLPAINQVVIEVACIGHVEVTQHHQGLGRVIRATHVRMTTARAKFARRPVAKMA